MKRILDTMSQMAGRNLSQRVLNSAQIKLRCHCRRLHSARKNTLTNADTTSCLKTLRHKSKLTIIIPESSKHQQLFPHKRTGVQLWDCDCFSVLVIHRLVLDEDFSIRGIHLEKNSFQRSHVYFETPRSIMTYHDRFIMSQQHTNWFFC